MPEHIIKDNLAIKSHQIIHQQKSVTKAFIKPQQSNCSIIKSIILQRKRIDRILVSQDITYISMILQNKSRIN